MSTPILRPQPVTFKRFPKIKWIAVRQTVLYINSRYETRQIRARDIFHTFRHLCNPEGTVGLMTWYISDKDCAEDENRPPGDYYLDIFIKQEWADRIMDQFKAGASQDVLFHREVIL